MRSYDQWKTDPGREPPTVRVKIEVIVEFTLDDSDGEDTDVEAQCEALADTIALDEKRFNDVSIDSCTVADFEVKP